MLLLRTLGGLSLEVDGHPGRGAAAQRGRLAVLAAIAAAGRNGITRDRLQALFWPESDAARARNALNQALHALRRDTGESLLLLGSDALRLNQERIRCDLTAFGEALDAGQLEEAAGLYQGPFLDGVHLNDSREAERWVEEERERIAVRFRAALRQLADRSEAQGRSGDAVAWWSRLAGVDRLSAPVACALMKAHVANGDRAAALRHAAAYEAELQAELGVDLDPTVAQLAREIREQFQEKGAARMETGSNHAPAAATPHAPASATTLEPIRLEAGIASRREPVPETVPIRRMTKGRRAAGLVALFALAGSALLARSPTVVVEGGRRVVVASAGPSSAGGATDPADALFRSRVAEGLAGVGLLEVVALPAGNPGRDTGAVGTSDLMDGARAAGARYAVITSVSKDGELVVLGAEAYDVSQRALLVSLSSRPTPRASVDSAATALGRRVMTSLTARVDPVLELWGHAASLPSSWEGLSEFREGLRDWQNGRPALAYSHFLAAASLDSSAATPLVWAAFVSGDSTSAALGDSIRVQRRRLGAWDRAMLGFLLARANGNPYAMHARAHDVLLAVPGSEFAWLVASSASVIGRATEALALLQGVSPDSGLIAGSVDYWTVLTSANHFLGRHEDELSAAEAALERDPSDRIFMQAKVKALSGLGRADEVMALCQKSLAFRPRPGWQWQPCGQAVVELAAHGHRDHARQIAELLDDGRAVSMDRNSPQTRLAMADWLFSSGDTAAARRALAAVIPRTQRDSAERRVMSALLDADAGRRAMVEAFLASATSADTAGFARGDWSVYRAQMYALLGARDEAVGWLAQALREGFAFRGVLHVFPGFDRLRGYPPYEALLAPVDDPEASGRLAGRPAGRFPGGQQ